MDRSFPQSRAHAPGLLSLGREGNVGFPGLEGTIRGAVGAPRRGFETSLELRYSAVVSPQAF